MMYRLFAVPVLLLCMNAMAEVVPDYPVKLFRSQTISLPVHRIETLAIDVEDPSASDTLFIYRSADGYPLSYAADISTAVCADGECRPLHIRLYWNITGRYLGFELPEKEFLSKTDHEPFSVEEYHRLSGILADSLSPLSGITYSELAARPSNGYDKVDGVTSATSRSVLEHVVPGAAYTTYSLWNLVYGEMQQYAVKNTIQDLSAELALLILKSDDAFDKVWALDHINGYISPSSELTDSLLHLISDENFTLAERAVQSFSRETLGKDSIQDHLLTKFVSNGYSLKNLILKKLKEAPALSKNVIHTLSDNLSAMNGELLTNTLDLFYTHKLEDTRALLKIATLLDADNRFISNKVFQFLKRLKPEHEQLKSRMQKYQAELP